MTTFESYINTPLEFQEELLAVYGQEEELIIFDIGACEAEDTVRYARLFPCSTIWALEPLPENFKKAYFNLVRYSIRNARLFQEALSDRVGPSLFYISSGRPDTADLNDSWDYGNKSSSLLAPSPELNKHFNWLSFPKQIEIRTNTLENFCQTRAIKKIDIAHIDVQGAELMVLKGAGNLLPNIGLIMIEVENVMLYRDQPLKKEVESYIEKQGFVKIRDTVGEVSGDQLYINKKLYFSYKKRRALSRIRKLRRADDVVGSVRRVGAEKDESDRYFKKSFSQAGEDLIVDFILNGRGVSTPTYIDVGASHPWHINNTALFYKRGSRGVNIEPNPLLFEEIRKERPRDINLNIGITNQPSGQLDFYVLSSSTLSTFSKAEAKRYVQEYGCEIVNVLKIESRTFNDVLSKHFFDACPDFLSLDAEGFELGILESIDFEKYKPKVICVETISFSTTGRGRKDRGIIEFLTSKGYLVYADTYINTIFVLRDFWVV